MENRVLYYIYATVDLIQLMKENDSELTYYVFVTTSETNDGNSFKIATIEINPEDFDNNGDKLQEYINKTINYILSSIEIVRKAFMPNDFELIKYTSLEFSIVNKSEFSVANLVKDVLYEPSYTEIDGTENGFERYYNLIYDNYIDIITVQNNDPDISERSKPLAIIKFEDLQIGIVHRSVVIYLPSIM